jgi:hypothetical protein
MSHHYLLHTPHLVKVLSLCHRGVLCGSRYRWTSRRRSFQRKGQGEGGVRVEGDANPPGPQPSQHRSCHFSPITLFPGLPPPCPHDPCARASHRWWPHVFFCSSGSRRGQITIPISSSTSVESFLSASSSVTTSRIEMPSRCFGTFRHFPVPDS